MSNDEQLLPILSFNSPIFFSVNPAQELSDTHKNQFQMLYDNRFGLKDLSVKQIAYSRVGAKHTFNTSFADKGSYYYKERTLNLGYKIKLTPNFNVGLNFNFALIQQREIRLTTFDLLPSVGVNYEVNSNSQVFFNLKSNFSKKSKSKVYFGLNHRLKNNLQALVLFNSGADLKFKLSGGFVYKMSKLNMANELSLVFANHEIPIAVSYRLNWKNIGCLFSVNYHLQLGFSNQLGLQYCQ